MANDLRRDEVSVYFLNQKWMKKDKKKMVQRVKTINKRGVDKQKNKWREKFRKEWTVEEQQKNAAHKL